MSLVEYREELHPRGEHGMWTEKGGSAEPTPREKAPAKAAQAEQQKSVERNGKTYLHFSPDIYDKVSDNLMGLDAPLRDSLDDYVKYGSQWNAWMRRNGGGPSSSFINFRDGLQKASLSDGLIVYRGIDNNSGFGTAIASMMHGETIRDAGFVSTSLKPIGKNSMRIFAPEGSHAIVTGIHQPGNKTDEVIFAPSSLTFTGLGEDGIPEFDLDQAVKADTALDAAVVDVGGDIWNRETAVRLEREYQENKPELEELVQKAIGSSVTLRSDETAEPGWNDLGGASQQEIEEKWKEAYYEQEYQFQVDNWKTEGYALDEAKSSVADEFNHGHGPDHDDWAIEALNEMHEDRKENGEKPIPFDSEQLVAAIQIHYETGYGKEKKPTIIFKEDWLDEPAGWSEEPSLPGIEPEKPADRLTKEMRDTVTEVIVDKFMEKAEEEANNMDPPEYLQEDAHNQIEEMWDDTSDDDKYQWAKDHTSLVDDVERDIEIAMPDVFDPLEETGRKTESYIRTQALARRLSVDRAMQVIEKRAKNNLALEDYLSKFSDNPAGFRGSVEAMDRILWDGWKSSSTSPHGRILQKAIADELGGRLRDLGPKHAAIETAVSNANEEFIGGYEAVKAYIRAKWETTQYLLDKANKPTLELFRSISFPELAKKPPVQVIGPSIGGGRWSAVYENGGVKQFSTKEEADEFADKENKSAGYEKPTVETVQSQQKMGPSYDKLPEFVILRSGAQSTTTDRGVANDWGDSGTRVVLRAKVPRTAVVSVPAYGQNIHEEHEVIIGGLAMVGWDAWKMRAPMFSEVKLQQ